MSRVFCLLMLAAIAFGLISGRAAETAGVLLTSGKDAITLAMTLAGSMMIWCGLMEILRRAGDVQRLGRVLRRILRPLFPGLEDDAAWSAMATNLVANMLGLGNAATPAGVEAARRLTSPTMGETGLRALAMLLVMNNSSLQWVPATVIALRAEAGSADPAGIWLPAMIVSGTSTLVAVGLMACVQRRAIRREQRSKLAYGSDSRRHCAAGHNGPDQYI